jgi:CheY-like chemotaxis protein
MIGTFEKAGMPRVGRPYLGRRALVIESDPDTRTLCVDRLERLGFEVAEVESGVEAVRAARRETPDLILLELELRDVPGPELVRWLRSNPALARVPIVAMDSSLPRRALPNALGSGVSAVLRKPLSGLRVDDAVARALPAAKPGMA